MACMPSFMAVNSVYAPRKIGFSQIGARLGVGSVLLTSSPFALRTTVQDFWGPFITIPSMIA